jgi:hypothetical protein
MVRFSARLDNPPIATNYKTSESKSKISIGRLLLTVNLNRPPI